MFNTTTRRRHQTMESMVDIAAADPEQVFTHRRADVTEVSWTERGQHHKVPYTRPASKWSPEALDRLLADIKGVRS
jgi:hypothetical protein